MKKIKWNKESSHFIALHFIILGSFESDEILVTKFSGQILNFFFPIILLRNELSRKTMN